MSLPSEGSPRTAAPSRGRSLSPEFPLLGLLSSEPGHGYDLKRRLADELPGLWNLRESQLYATLKRLEARGLITGRGARGAGRAAKRRLRLTPRGARMFEAWLTTPTPPSIRAIRVEFLSRLHFALQRDPALARRLINEQEESILRGLGRLETFLAGLPLEPPLPRLGAQLRIRQLRSAIDWLSESRGALGLEDEAPMR